MAKRDNVGKLAKILADSGIEFSEYATREALTFVSDKQIQFLIQRISKGGPEANQLVNSLISKGLICKAGVTPKALVHLNNIGHVAAGFNQSVVSGVTTGVAKVAPNLVGTAAKVTNAANPLGVAIHGVICMTKVVTAEDGDAAIKEVGKGALEIGGGVVGATLLAPIPVVGPALGYAAGAICGSFVGELL